MIKVTYTIFPRTDLPAEEVRIRWMEDHGARMEKHASALRVSRYVQTLRQPHPVDDSMAKVRGISKSEPLGMAEIYWRSLEDMEFSLTDPDARRAYRELIEDEKRFAAWSVSTPWIGVEREVIAPGNAE